MVTVFMNISSDNGRESYADFRFNCESETSSDNIYYVGFWAKSLEIEGELNQHSSTLSVDSQQF